MGATSTPGDSGSSRERRSGRDRRRFPERRRRPTIPSAQVVQRPPSNFRRRFDVVYADAEWIILKSVLLLILLFGVATILRPHVNSLHLDWFTPEVLSTPEVLPPPSAEESIPRESIHL